MELDVIGITRSREEMSRAQQVLDEVFLMDLETDRLDGLGQFDCIVCSHVLEHLRDPRSVLGRLQQLLVPTGLIVVALPNVLHWRQRLAFMRGEFRYSEGGLMDDTHVVFFDWETAQLLISNSGLRVVDAQGDGSVPWSRYMGRVGRSLDRWFLRRAPGLFSWQFVIIARHAS